MINVVAAIIVSGNRFLACQRPADKDQGMLWEFVGGKVEAGETKPQALIRECREELGITLKVCSQFTEVIHTYPEKTVDLTAFFAEIESGTPQKLEHNDIRWLTLDESKNYQFCPADIEILEKLKKRGLKNNAV